MKKLFAVLLVLVLLLTGCSEAIDDSAVRADAEVLLKAFMDRDYETCRMIVRDEVSDEDLKGIFEAICGELEDLESYEMTAVAWKRTVSDGRDVISVQYLIESETGKYYFSVARDKELPGIAGFQLSLAAADAEPTTPMGIAHWIVLAIGAAVIGFIIWMIVDCARRRMKRKWLWLPLILLGTLALTLTVRGGNVSFNFRGGLYLGMMSLSTFVRGGFQLMICVPLGAIVYFFKRKDLTLQEEIHAEGKEEA